MANLTATVTPDPDEPGRVRLSIVEALPDGRITTERTYPDTDDAIYAAGMELVTRLRAETDTAPPGGRPWT